MNMNLGRDELIRLPTAPPDPIMLGAKGQRPFNYNSATGRVLFHQNHMPMGEHAGKIMERVPGQYLLFVYSQSWSCSKKWFPVRSYVERHLEEIQQRAAREVAKAKETLPSSL